MSSAPLTYAARLKAAAGSEGRVTIRARTKTHFRAHNSHSVGGREGILEQHPGWQGIARLQPSRFTSYERNPQRANKLEVNGSSKNPIELTQMSSISMGIDCISSCCFIQQLRLFWGRGMGDRGLNGLDSPDER